MVEVQSVQDGVGEQASTGEPSAAELTTAIKPQRRLQAACNLLCGVAVVISGFYNPTKDLGFIMKCIVVTGFWGCFLALPRFRRCFFGARRLP